MITIERRTAVLHYSGEDWRQELTHYDNKASMLKLTLDAFSEDAKYNIASQLKATSPYNFASKGIKLTKG